MAATEGTKYAGAFEILYKFKLIERAKSVVIVAETADRARDIFTKQHADDEKQPRIVAVEETVVTL